MFNKYSTQTLRDKYIKCLRVQDKTSKFYDLQEKLEKELNSRNRAAIFRTACKVVKNEGFNQFMIAKRYADCVLNDPNYFVDMTQWEISSFDCKNNHPTVVYFN